MEHIPCNKKRPHIHHERLHELFIYFSARYILHGFCSFCSFVISRLMEYVNKRRLIFVSLSKLECGLQEIKFREIRRHLTFSANWNKLDRVCKKGDLIFKVAFSLPSPSSMLKLPINR